MKKYFYILAALSIAPTFALAQSTLENDVDAELDSMYASQQAPAATTKAAQVQEVKAAQPLNLNGSQPIYILNQAPSTASAQVQQQQVQKQPTTVIEAAPLAESRAEQIRKNRQDTEVQTEQKIVEKLEQSRMEDEKRRADVLFGDKFNNLNNNQQQQVPVQQPVVQQPVAQPVIQPIVVQEVKEPKENTRDIIREELASAMKVEKEEVLPPVQTKYVAGLLGIGDYPDVSNVKGNYALGVAFGSKVDGFIIEGSFLYSNYTVKQNQYNYYGNSNVDINQYTGSLAAKVQFFDGIVKPVIGGLVAYSYRQYELKDNGYAYNSGYSPYAINNSNGSTSANSHAVDIGALVGADLEFSPKYSLGLDFRYMWNLSNRINYDGNNAAYNELMNTNPIEKLQYYVMSISGRVNF
ncbi:MAG: hypothetical protein ACKOX6_12250 [Bdellovibrio sp.]